MNTIYKGFAIASVDGRFVLENGKSYATLAAAKGAISKAEKTALAPENEFVKSVINLKTQPCVMAAQANTVIKLTSVNETDSAIRAVLKLAKERAILPSRNKREGKFAGKGKTKHFRTGNSAHFWALQSLKEMSKTNM